jgi:hypothetical protein
MRGARGWLIAAAASILIAGVAYIAQPHQDSPEHSSRSDATNGTSALLLFAQAMGHPADKVEGNFRPPDSNGMMFVFTPTSPYTSDEAGRAYSFVRSGGVLVYASEHGDPELDRAFGVNRTGLLEGAGNEVAAPVVDGVNRVAGGAVVEPLLVRNPAQVPFLRTQPSVEGPPGRSVIGYLQRIDSGTLVVLADPLVLCNGYLDKLDNGRLLSDLLGLARTGAPVAVDEYHHGLIFSDFTPQAWLTTPWGAALLWLLVAVFVGLLLRGRAFGPLIERPAETPRSDAEWPAAVGQLLRRSSARAVTLGMLATATERAVAARTGLPLQPRERFWNALWVRAPELAADLADAENSLQRSSDSEGQLLSAAQRLHHLAHPVAEERGRSSR